MSSRYHRPTPLPKKSRWHVDTGLPFPNFALGKTEIPAVCRCIYDGQNFFVTNNFDMHTLHYNGAYGTSTLTFRGPSYENTSFLQKPYYKKKFAGSYVTSEASNGISDRSSSTYVKSNPTKRLRVDMKASTPELCVHTSEESSPSNSEQTGIKECDRTAPIKNDEGTTCSSRRRTISDMSVDEDTGLSDLNLRYPSKNHTQTDENVDGSGRRSRCDSKPDANLVEDEKLLLMPEEAIFLSFGVGCLAIYNVQGQTVDYRQCWKNLVSANPDFPTRYAVYHYYRGKNWVPKAGNNYGASYVLYEGGPQINHASYIVHIIESSKPKPTWLELTAWQRLATHLAKHLLVCEVSVPKEFRPELSDPRSVFEMRLNELSLCRWAPNVEF